MSTLEYLATASLTELRCEWQRRYGVPPKLRSPDLLRRILAWRIQVQDENGLDVTTRRLLRADRPTPELRLQPGTLVSREWKGREHQVEVSEDGFLYAGREWKSLSEVAREITGTRWNGPRFFGLRAAE